jgi:hypothetical protein
MRMVRLLMANVACIRSATRAAQGHASVRQETMKITKIIAGDLVNSVG